MNYTQFIKRELRTCVEGATSSALSDSDFRHFNNGVKNCVKELQNLKRKGKPCVRRLHKVYKSMIAYRNKLKKAKES